MARLARIEYEGAIYHVLSRGDRREDIFWDDVDRSRFLELLERACDKTAWQVHAYCLMSNHFHLVIETPRANLVAGMKWFLGTYTMAFNRRHRLSGHLFAGRYKSLLVDESNPLYLRAVCDYVHLKKARAGILESKERLESWSSYPSYLGKPKARAACLRCDRLLGEHGLGEETRRTRLELSRRVEALRLEKEGASEKEIRNGWLYGKDAFIALLLDRFETPAKAKDWAKQRTETGEEVAQRIVRAGMRELGWSESDLQHRRKSNGGKVALARELRNNTSVSLDWIARRLEMGSWTNVSNLLRGQTSQSEEWACIVFSDSERG